MYDAIVTILASSVASGMLTGLLLWLTRTWLSERIKNSIKHEYDQKLEALKASLFAENETAIERLRLDFRLDAFQHETQFAHLHVCRAKTIAKTYRLLQRLHSTTRRYVSELETPGQSSWAERRKDVASAMDAFETYYLPRELFLPETTANCINSLRSKHFKVIQKYKRGVEGGRDEISGKDSRGEAVEMMDGDVTPVFDNLKREFRLLLGDTLTPRARANANA